MHLAEHTLGDYRIYGAALEAEGDQGFWAAVVVRQNGLGSSGREVFRDERLEDGLQWADPTTALSVALDVGKAAIRAQNALDQLLNPGA